MTDPGTTSAAAHRPEDSVAALQKQFAAIIRGRDPLGWAVAAYRLGLATAEQPVGPPQDNLRSALGLYQQAAEVLTEDRAPVEHARILNAAGSAHRLLGESDRALQLFDRSVGLLRGRGAEGEEAAVRSNLGLALSEMGRIDGAIQAFAEAVEILPTETDEHLRTRIATQHNLAQAHAAKGTTEGFAAAVDVLEQAAESAKTIDAPMHLAMVWHTLGVTHKGWHSGSSGSGGGGTNLTGDDGHVAAAIEAFERCLTIFTSVGFPFQHAIAKHNLGHALAARSDLASLQRALVCYEDALNIFDPRLHGPHWREVYANTEALDLRLAALAPRASRADHTAAYLGALDEAERLAVMRQRFVQLERLPPRPRVERLTEFAYAVVTQPADSYVATLRTMISVLMELPESMLRATLDAQLAAHALLEPGDRRAADFILDEAINLLLFGPQRIRVRDLLSDIGWERP
ncbi:MAG: tetratricopeptide repeat protein [Actinomycetota bacterium]